MAGNGRLRHRLGREGSSLLRVAPPRRGQDGQNGMAFIWNRYAVAAGPRLRSFVLRTSVLQKRGVCSCWEFQGASRNGGAFQSCSEGQDSQQLSELWFRQSVCWRQLTAAAQAASSLTRIRRAAVRFWRQATCICHLLEQFFNRRGSRNRLRARGPRSQGHVPHKFGVHPAQTNGLPLPAQLLDQPRVHLNRILQLLDCDPLADRVGLVDAAGAEHQRVHIVLIALGFGAVWDGDRPRCAGRAGSRRWSGKIRRMGICGIRMGVGWCVRVG